ncbi:MAG: arginine repressor [Armatimonadetes bacterium]|nr:arginine repressor [Armatimonadota bacterium]
MRSRDRRVLDIIARRPITTQAELVAALRSAGIRVTQATVSRDIKRLGLVKVPTGDGAYRYRASEVPRPSRAEIEAMLRRAVRDYVVDTDEGAGLVVVKTSMGSAGVVAEAIDEASWPEVVGTVAGDNTIIVVPRRPGDRAVILSRLRGMT